MGSRINIQLSPAACIFLALSILVLPLKWLLAAMIAAAFHELCHAFAVYLCGGQIYRLDFRANGAKIAASPLKSAQNLFCILAGPVGGLLLLPFSKWIPRIAICAAFQSLYNLLPIYSLDGGRALQCALCMFLSDNVANQVCSILEKICLAAILLLSLYGAVILNLGIGALIPAVMIFLHRKYGKTPCKQGI